MVQTHMFTEIQQQPPLKIDIISNHSDIGVLADQINVKTNHKPNQWSVVLFFSLCNPASLGD